MKWGNKQGYQIKIGKSYFCRACYTKGVGHQPHLPFRRDSKQRQAEEWESFTREGLGVPWLEAGDVEKLQAGLIEADLMWLFRGARLTFSGWS